MHRALRPGGAVHDLEALYNCGCPIDSVDERGRTVLHVAAAAGYEEAVEWLLERGADTTLTAADGRTALHSAAASGHVRTCELLLLDAVDPAAATRAMQAVDAHGQTAAEIAAAANHMSIVRALLDVQARCVRGGAPPHHPPAKSAGKKLPRRPLVRLRLLIHESPIRR